MPFSVGCHCRLNIFFILPLTIQNTLNRVFCCVIAVCHSTQLYAMVHCYLFEHTKLLHLPNQTRNIRSSFSFPVLFSYPTVRDCISHTKNEYNFKFDSNIVEILPHVSGVFFCVILKFFCPKATLGKPIQ